MATVNIVILEGIVLGNDETSPVEVRQVGEKKVANFRMVVSESRKDKDGNWVKDERALFLTVFRWQNGDKDSTFNTITQYLKKGDHVLVEGRLEQENWVDKKSGEKKNDKKVKLSSIKILPKRGESTPKKETEDGQGEREENDNDIPF